MPKHPPSTRLQQPCRRKPIVKPTRRGNFMCCAGSFAKVCLPGLLHDENMHVIPGNGAPRPRTRASARRAVAARMHGGRLAEVDSQTLLGRKLDYGYAPVRTNYAEARTTTLGRKGPMSSTGPRQVETTLSNSSTDPSPALPAARLSWPHTHLSPSCLDDSLPRSYFNV
jgi:hypothetical protein